MNYKTGDIINFRIPNNDNNYVDAFKEGVDKIIYFSGIITDVFCGGADVHQYQVLPNDNLVTIWIPVSYIIELPNIKDLATL